MAASLPIIRTMRKKCQYMRLWCSAASVTIFSRSAALINCYSVCHWVGCAASILLPNSDSPSSTNARPNRCRIWFSKCQAEFPLRNDRRASISISAHWIRDIKCQRFECHTIENRVFPFSKWLFCRFLHADSNSICRPKCHARTHLPAHGASHATGLKII